MLTHLKYHLYRIDVMVWHIQNVSLPVYTLFYILSQYVYEFLTSKLFRGFKRRFALNYLQHFIMKLFTTKVNNLQRRHKNIQLAPLLSHQMSNNIVLFQGLHPTRRMHNGNYLFFKGQVLSTWYINNADRNHYSCKKECPPYFLLN